MNSLDRTLPASVRAIFFFALAAYAMGSVGSRMKLADAASTQTATVTACMQYVPSEPAVFEEGSGSTPTMPDCWLKLNTENPGLSNPAPMPASMPETLLLLHRLTSGGGHERLVALMASDQKQGMQLRPIVLDCTSSLPSASATAIPLAITNHLDLPLKIHFAQTTQSDPSHFTLSVNYGSQTQTIEGQLLDDDSVRLVPSFGWIDSGGNWQVEDAPHHDEIKQPLKIMQLGYPARIDSVGSWLSRDGKLLAIRSDNAQHHNQIDLWDTETERKVSSWDAGGSFAWPRFSDDGASITGLDNGERIYYRFAIPSGEADVANRSQRGVHATQQRTFVLHGR